MNDEHTMLASHIHMLWREHRIFLVSNHRQPNTTWLGNGNTPTVLNPGDGHHVFNTSTSAKHAKNSTQFNMHEQAHSRSGLPPSGHPVRSRVVSGMYSTPTSPVLVFIDLYCADGARLALSCGSFFSSSVSGRAQALSIAFVILQNHHFLVVDCLGSRQQRVCFPKETLSRDFRFRFISKRGASSSDYFLSFKMYQLLFMVLAVPSATVWSYPLGKNVFATQNDDGAEFRDKAFDEEFRKVTVVGSAPVSGLKLSPVTLYVKGLRY